MCAAMGTEPRLKILRLLFAGQPDGMVVGNIQQELGIPGSTLSHHLEKLRIAGLVNVRRERRYPVVFRQCGIPPRAPRVPIRFVSSGPKLAKVPVLVGTQRLAGRAADPRPRPRPRASKKKRALPGRAR